MRLRTIRPLVIFTFALLVAPLITDAQQAREVPRIGFISAISAVAGTVNANALREGLLLLGYTEGQNIAIETHFTEGQFERIPQLVADLSKAGVAVLVVGGTTPAKMAVQATSTVPIVFVAVGDPIEAGLVKSLAHPGGNATGMSTSYEQGFAGKWVEFLWEAVPTLSTIAVLHNPSNPSNVSYWTVLQLAAQKLGLQLQSLEVRTVEDLENALETIARSHPDALIVATDPFLFARQARVLEAVRAHRLPSMFGFRQFVDAGGLMSYGASVPRMWRRTAYFVDRILKGVKPSDLGCRKF